MRKPRSRAAGAIPLIAFALCGCAESEPAAALDTTRIDYREDEGSGRIVAEVVVELASVPGGAGDEAELTIVPSALGPFIDPIPGLRGVRSANLHTARELARLFAEERIDVVTRRVDGEGEVRGAVRISRSGRVPERRRREDGSLDYLAQSRDVLPLALSLESGVLGRGDWRTEVLVDGVPRLVVEFAVRDGGGEIMNVCARSTHERDEVNP